jgi:hypothetical protein
LCGGGAPEKRAFFNCYNLIFTIRTALARAEIGNPKRKRMAAGFRRAASAFGHPLPRENRRQRGGPIFAIVPIAMAARPLWSGDLTRPVN